MQLEFFPEDEPEVSTFDGANYTIVCPKCNQAKPESEYYLYENIRQNGSMRKCKPCYNAYNNLKRSLKKENPYPHKDPVCACCGTRATTEVLALDHDHDTGAFRGYLCRNCNTGLGALGDDIKGLERAMDYLRKHYDGQS